MARTERDIIAEKIFGDKTWIEPKEALELLKKYEEELILMSEAKTGVPLTEVRKKIGMDSRGIKYLCVGAWVNENYISARRVQELYDIPFDKCIFNDSLAENDEFKPNYSSAIKVIEVWPDPDGEYHSISK